MRFALLSSASLLAGTALASLNAYVNYTTMPFCGYANGSISIGVSGGTAPYTFAWDDGPTTAERTGLPGGTYTVTVTDALAATDVEVVTLTDQPDMGFITITSFIIDGARYHPCVGQCNGQLLAAVGTLQGVAPYTVNMEVNLTPVPQLGTDQQGDPYFGTFCANDQVTVYVQDANGCHTTETRTIEGPAGLPVDVVGVSGACDGAANGSAILDIPEDPQLWIPQIQVRDAFNTTVFIQEFLTGTVTVPDLAAGDYTIHQTWTAVVAGCDDVAGAFTIPDLGTECGSVNGTLFIDHDQNCSQDLVDIPVPSRIIRIDPGPSYALTDASGHYGSNRTYGSYTASVVGSDLLQICPVAAPAPFDITALAPNVVLDLADSSTVPLDISVEAGTGPAHPGFTFNCAAHIVNTTAALSGALTVTLTLDPQLGFIDATPTPASVTGNVVTWNLPGLLSYAHTDVHVLAQIPPDPGIIGTYLNGSVNVSQPFTEGDPGNNTALFQRLVTGSFDPNCKRVEPEGIFLIGEDDYLSYTIEFQNTGTDTAFTVVVVDTLSSYLDPATLVLGASSHAYAASMEGSGVLRFTFDDILLPDSNANEPASHGFVSFRIRPVQPLLPGTVISNTANIYFDFNPPVITAPSVLTAEFSTDVREQGQGRLRLYPNPVNDLLQVALPTDAVILRIRANDGREVVTRSGRAARSVIEVQGLPSGAYSMEVITAGGDVHRARFIKQ